MEDGGGEENFVGVRFGGKEVEVRVGGGHVYCFD